MDAFVEEAWQAPMFRKRKLLYLYCFDTVHDVELTVPSLPFLNLKCLFGHISFPGALDEWRIVVFPHCECGLASCNRGNLKGRLPGKNICLFLRYRVFEDHIIHFNAQFTYDFNCKLIKI